MTLEKPRLTVAHYTHKNTETPIGFEPGAFHTRKIVSKS